MYHICLYIFQFLFSKHNVVDNITASQNIGNLMRVLTDNDKPMTAIMNTICTFNVLSILLQILLKIIRTF